MIHALVFGYHPYVMASINHDVSVVCQNGVSRINPSFFALPFDTPFCVKPPLLCHFSDFPPPSLIPFLSILTYPVSSLWIPPNFLYYFRSPSILFLSIIQLINVSQITSIKTLVILCILHYNVNIS